MNIDWQAVILAAAAAFILGGIWYGPIFGRLWRKAEGKPERKSGGHEHPAFCLRAVVCADVGRRRSPGHGHRA